MLKPTPELEELIEAAERAGFELVDSAIMGQTIKKLGGFVPSDLLMFAPQVSLERARKIVNARRANAKA